MTKTIFESHLRIIMAHCNLYKNENLLYGTDLDNNF